MTHVWAVSGYAWSPFALSALNRRLSPTSIPSPAAEAPAVVASTYLPAWFSMLAYLRPEALASERSAYPIAPLVDFTICATPELPCPACVSLAHSTVDPLLSFQTPWAAPLRYSVKFWVVPDPSARWATTISVAGSFSPGLSAAMALSFHLVISRWKILAMVGAESCSLAAPSRL